MGLFSKKEPKPKPDRQVAVDDNKDNTAKPVKGKPPKPVKPAKEKPVKAAKDKPVKGKGKKGKQPVDLEQDMSQFAQPAVDAGVGMGMDMSADMGVDYNTNAGFNDNQQMPQYNTPMPVSNPVPYPSQNVGNFGMADTGIPTEDMIVSNMMNQMRNELSMDWHELADNTVVRTNGVVCSLSKFCGSFNQATIKGRKDGMALRATYGKIVGLLINKATPAFLTSIQRIVDGHLQLIKVCKPFDAREASYGEWKTYIEYEEIALKYNLLMVGVLNNGRPYIAEAAIDTTDNRFVGRFPEVPSVVALMAIIPDGI